ncbi:FixH family protein [Deinococcus ruber]|uniref:YtkA-like domain-containing protein n=1 Tax=Deinococcus ruber TaxID=1848197 RepID=A0A918CJS0_9DEIO|nr:FixH family protein [Deinococcus ruber]GGR28200.1 hypothetical protein GCM10008957_44280 [Deinococcus ruber]
MKRVGLLLALLVCGCAPSSRSALSIRLLPGPALHVQPSAEVVVELSVANRQLAAADVSAQADMRHPGMGTAVATVTPLGRGRYRLSNLDLPMAGDWVLSVKASTQGHPVSGAAAFSVLP